MDSDRWRQIQDLFQAIVDRSEPERESYLKLQCGDDQQLMLEVQALLVEDSRRALLLDRDVAEVADQLLFEGPSLLPPTGQFGPYRVVRVLGEGGMGVVYLAERQDLDRRMAIKVLRDAWLSPSRRERFLNERRMLAQLNHPSIARLYDADALPNGIPWFVMEYVEGVPLTEYCRQHNCSVRRRLELVRTVAEAVQYAHRNAVIHRDLKPSNILVREDGTVRLLDFGIAKQLESVDVPVERTQTGLRLMTPAYASPEQIRGEPAGVQTDVYSLGVVLYELLAKRLPYDLSNRTANEAERIIVREKPRKPSAVALQSADPDAAPSVSRSAWADLDVLCLTAMHNDAKRRYQSVEAFLRDINHYLKDEPLDARPDTAHYRLGKFVRRNRNAVAAAVLTLALVLGLVVFFVVRLANARNAALADAARANRIQIFMRSLFQGGDAAEGPAENLRVVTMLDRGVEEARSLKATPSVQADLFETLGGICEKLGKFDQAESLLGSALKERESVYGPDNAEVAKSLTALALLRADQAMFPKAESLAREGLAMSKRHLPPNAPGVAKAAFALGIVLEDRGAYTQAISVFERAIEIQSASANDRRDLAASLSELANTNFYAGHLNASERLNRRVLTMHRQLYGNGHPLVADTLINLGAIEFERGHYPAAETYDRQALQINEAWYGKDNPEIGSDLTILGRALVAEQHYHEAESLLKRALAIEERAYGPVHPRVASALSVLGHLAESRGELDEAEADFRRMAAIYRSVYGKNHYLIGIALSNLGSVYMKRKQYANAEEFFRRAIAIFTKTLSLNHLQTGIARIKLGHALLLERRYADAETESLGGYVIVVGQTSPSITWLRSAREDLVIEYGALREPQQAARFRAELSRTGGPPSTVAPN